MNTKNLFLAWQYKIEEGRPWFLLSRLDSEPSLYLFRYTGGAVRSPVGGINIELLQTSDRIAKMFMAHVVPIDLQIEKLHQSNEQLIQARDVLLPRLINGEISV